MENNNRAPREEAEEFNAFNATSSAPAGEAQRPQKRPAQKNSAPKKKKNTSFFKQLDTKTIIIAAAILLVLILVVGIIIAVATRDRHIMRKDNAFVLYSDSNGYHLMSNGYQIEKVFEGEVTLVPADDNSFAYVTEEIEGELYIYLLKGKKLEPMTTSGVEEIVDYAGLKPGVVYKEKNTYRLYSEEYGVETITNNETAEDFMVSGDASTVVYTTAKKDEADMRELLVFKDGSNERLNSKTNCIPAAISNYGDYIYASFIKDDVRKLAVFTTKDLDNPQSDIIAESEGFEEVILTNVKGNEILFVTTNAVTVEDEETQEMVETTKTYTKLYRYPKRGDHTATSLASARMDLLSSDPDIVYLQDFSDIYLMGSPAEDQSQRGIYHLDKKYEVTRLARYVLPESASEDLCTISPDGKFLYYLNATKDLIQMNLRSDTYETKELCFGVEEFYITQKGNIYYLDENMKLFYREATARKNLPIADFVTDITFYRYSNTLYFTKEEGESIFSTKEGSDENPVKMGDTQVTSLPLFTNPNSKHCYATFYDMDNGGILLYTSNGKSFKKITNDCITINGFDLTDIFE